MYRGFNLQIDVSAFENSYAEGLRLHRENENFVKGTLSKYLDEDGVMSATLLTEAWFPSIDADVFISHAHTDNAGAVALAGWLKENFGLTSFIDSTIWGSAKHLQRRLDNAFCFNKEEGTYYYDKRNRSTSCVNIMLSSALHKMIDRCESVIFLNTPNSVSYRGFVEAGATHSPWIYSEILMTRLVKQEMRRETRLLRKSEMAHEVIAEDVRLKFDLQLDHLTDIDSVDLERWRSNVCRSRGYGAETLDTLYEMFPRRA